MSRENPLAVVAIGGNSLIVDDDHATLSEQAANAETAMRHVVDMIEAGWNVVITHGNGPQVGFILQRSEIGAHEVPPIPMDYATSNTQGSIGYMLQRALANEFRRRRVDRRAIALITQTLVDRNDPAFENPTKFIGPHLDEAMARQRVEERGWEVKRDGKSGWRRVVSSPLPREIVELEVIRVVVHTGTVVIACGGGGMPVIRDTNGDLRGVEAVIDKDYASSLLAQALEADLFLISTAVERVALHFGEPEQRWLERMTLSEARAYYDEGHFPAGSMGPKMKAVIDFVAATGGRGLVTDPENLARALDGDTGTLVTPD